MNVVEPQAWGRLVLAKAEGDLGMVAKVNSVSAELAQALLDSAPQHFADDHGVQPSALVVFEDKLVRTHFLRLAREEMQAARVQVSLWVSHSKAIDVLGPLGGAWRAPGDWDSHQALPPP